MRCHPLLRFAVLLILVSLNACASRIPLRRTLPDWVESVSVPMFTNSSTQPGVEEFATQYTVEEFLADGRLAVVSKPDADLVVAVNIIDYAREVESFEDDEFASVSRDSVLASVRLYEPSNLKKPFADLGRVEATRAYVSDFRRTDYVPDVDARKEVMRALAQSVVDQTVNKFHLSQVQAQGGGSPKAARSARSPYDIRTTSGITMTPDIRIP